MYCISSQVKKFSVRPAYRLFGYSSMMWRTVRLSVPQSQSADGVFPHLYILPVHLRCPVLILLAQGHIFRGKLKPANFVVMHCRSWAYTWTASFHWVFYDSQTEKLIYICIFPTFMYLSIFQIYFHFWINTNIHY